MGNRISERDLRRLADHFEEHGCRVRQAKNGWTVLFPGGGQTVIHTSVSDVRGWKNTKAHAIRSGIPWPKWFKF